MSDAANTLSPVAAQAITELREKFGVEPTVDEIVWLHNLGQRVENPGGAPHAGLAGAPVCVGNVALWPLSMGASRWFLEVGEPLFGKQKFGELVLAYAMAHSRQPEVLWRFTSPDAVRSAVKDWQRVVGVRWRELEAALYIAQGREPIRPPPDPKAEPIPAYQTERNLRVVIAELCAEHPGTTPDYWRWGTGMTEALECLYAVRSQKRAKGEAPDPNEPSNAAFICLRHAVAAIIQNHKPKVAPDGQ